MTVYLDVIWSLNLLFDSLLLFLTAIILKRKVPFWRVLVGGLIGSIIILLNFTSLYQYSSHPISKLLFSVIMVLFVFGYKRFSYFIKALMTFYVATFLVGGALIGVHFFVEYDSKLTAEVLRASVEGFGDPISWGFVLIGFPVFWHFSRRNIETMEMTKIRYDQIVSVSLSVDGQAFQYKGLVDSGNQLYDPVSKMPVMFVSVKKQWEDTPEPIRMIAENPDPLEMNHSLLPEEWKSRLRIIPCRVVGQEHQLIFAIKPDHILIEIKGTQYFWEQGLVSFTMQELSPEDAYRCIVHPKMLTGHSQQGDSEKVS